MLLCRRFPPIAPPLRPMAAMYWARFTGRAGTEAGLGGAGASLVDCSTIHFASWFGSRGRLPCRSLARLPFGFGCDLFASAFSGESFVRLPAFFIEKRFAGIVGRKLSTPCLVRSQVYSVTSGVLKARPVSYRCLHKSLVKLDRMCIIKFS
jgi:hypothetical protein